MNQTLIRTVLLTGFSLALLVAPFFVSTGFFTIDEVVYVLSVQAFHAGQGFVVDNGYHSFPSEDLSLLGLMIETPAGLTSQYPSGVTIVGALFFELLGARGLLLLNAIGAVGTLFVTFALARKLFNSVPVANLSIVLLVVFSFIPEFAVGYWPHMVSVFSVALAFYLFLNALDDEKPFRWAVASGLVLGAGLLFRLDGVLLLVPIALVSVLFGRKPLQIFMGGLLGLAPVFGVMSWINHIKFGSINPISYGSSDGGGVDPMRYVSFAVVAAVATLVIWGARTYGGAFRVTWLKPKVWSALAVAVGLAAIVGVPQGQHVALRLAQGFYALILDARSIIDLRPGIYRGPENTLFLWGMTKKALGQSLPWLGLLAALFVLPLAGRRRSIAIVLIVISIWMLPFILRIWHGGLGSNMRYFLPTLPFLAALCSWIIVEISARLDSPLKPIFAGAVLGFLSVQLWVTLRESGAAGVQQILSTYTLYAVAVLAIVGLLVRRLLPLAGVAVGLGLALSLTNSVFDQSAGQLRRAATFENAGEFSKIAGPIVVYGAPENALLANQRADIVAAIKPFTNDTFDKAYVESALSGGYRVFVPSVEFGEFTLWFEPVAPTPPNVPDGLFEIVNAR